MVGGLPPVAPCRPPYGTSDDGLPVRAFSTFSSTNLSTHRDELAGYTSAVPGPNDCGGSDGRSPNAEPWSTVELPALIRPQLEALEWIVRQEQAAIEIRPFDQ